MGIFLSNAQRRARFIFYARGKVALTRQEITHTTHQRASRRPTTSPTSSNDAIHSQVFFYPFRLLRRRWTADVVQLGTPRVAPIIHRLVLLRPHMHDTTEKEEENEAELDGPGRPDRVPYGSKQAALYHQLLLLRRRLQLLAALSTPRAVVGVTAGVRRVFRAQRPTVRQIFEPE